MENALKKAGEISLKIVMKTGMAFITAVVAVSKVLMEKGGRK